MSANIILNNTPASHHRLVRNQFYLPYTINIINVTVKNHSIIAPLDIHGHFKIYGIIILMVPKTILAQMDKDMH